ncbi:hypothetical protein [Hanstruepera marina]|uniref:hypothetical protein n=1 Tax=Hanstruepera marina TaxID=2873265 RepID=UPI001CA6412D|nr:hypothetical protein [Hanstruepera marina]
MSKIVVYDEIMGSGKTYNAIKRMKEYLSENKKFIYITPFKKEITRVVEALNSPEVFAPIGRDDNGDIPFELEYDYKNADGDFDLNAKPKFKYLNKRAQFLKMASNGVNIISTHALFMGLKREDFSLFSDYILILDEVATPLKPYKITEHDFNMLKNQDMIIIDKNTNQVKFINDEYIGKFKEVKALCNNSTVYYLDKIFLVWVFPIEIFREFKEVQILTYLFEGSLLSPYFKMYNIEYTIKSNNSISQLNEVKRLLNIYEGVANSDNTFNTFSKSWSEALSSSRAKKITNNVSNIFKRNFKTKSHENAYTTFKSCKSKLAGKTYTKGFIAINARASNENRHKKSMAYLGNRYFDPQTINFFRERGIKLNEDLWALSELIQWIWRGCIRDKKAMNLYIPNSRMRSLLKEWLEGKYIVENAKLKKAV